MSKNKNPKQPFRRSQVVSPVPSDRRFANIKTQKKSFDIYVTDTETGEVTLAATILALSHREALQKGRKQLWASPVLRKITHAVYTAVEVDQAERSHKPK